MNRSSPQIERSRDRRRFLAEAGAFATARRLGVLSVILQAIILGYLSGAKLFPATVIVLACGLGATRRRLQLDRSSFQLLCFVMAIGFLLHFLYFPFPIPEESQFLRTSESHSVARFLIAVQLLAIAVQPESRPPPIWLAGLGAMCLPFATNVQIREAVHRPLLPWMMAFVVIAALYCSHARRALATLSRTNRSLRTCVQVAALVAAVLLGGGSAVALRVYERHIESFLRDYLGQGSALARSGFSPSGRLNDVLAWKTLQAEHVVLRVFSDREPGYLRGKAFDTYQTPQWDYAWRSWTSELPMKRVRPYRPDRGFPPVRAGDRLYELSRDSDGPWTALDAWPESQTSGYVFTPLPAAYVAVNSEQVTRDGHGNLRVEDREEMPPYVVLVSLSAPDAEETLPDEMRGLLTGIDADIDPFVRELADRLFADCPTPRAKIERVQSWFRANFEYELGVRVPRENDPLTYFLRERPAAHCEFFATGTAVLLKLTGVPCRYVTGYVVAEENAVGGYWIARNKDAHAWVEAFDDINRQWVIVESTPPAGVPAHRGEAVPSQFLDSLRQSWVMLKESLWTIGIGGLLRGPARWVWSIPGLVAILLVVTGMLLRKSPPLPVLKVRRTDRRLQGIHAVLKQLDRQAKINGLTRHGDETLLQFADRVRRADTDPQWRREMARCYDLYALLRFRGQTGPDSVARLRSSTANLRRRNR